MTTENKIATVIALVIITGLSWYVLTHPVRSGVRDGGTIVVDGGAR